MQIYFADYPRRNENEKMNNRFSICLTINLAELMVAQIPFFAISLARWQKHNYRTMETKRARTQNIFIRWAKRHDKKNRTERNKIIIVESVSEGIV